MASLFTEKGGVAKLFKEKGALIVWINENGTWPDWFRLRGIGLITSASTGSCVIFSSKLRRGLTV
jgi:hypothetical protein